MWQCLDARHHILYTLNDHGKYVIFGTGGQLRAIALLWSCQGVNICYNKDAMEQYIVHISSYALHNIRAFRKTNGHILLALYPALYTAKNLGVQTPRLQACSHCPQCLGVYDLDVELFLMAKCWLKHEWFMYIFHYYIFVITLFAQLYRY